MKRKQSAALFILDFRCYQTRNILVFYDKIDTEYIRLNQEGILPHSLIHINSYSIRSSSPKVNKDFLNLLRGNFFCPLGKHTHFINLFVFRPSPLYSIPFTNICKDVSGINSKWKKAVMTQYCPSLSIYIMPLISLMSLLFHMLLLCYNVLETFAVYLKFGVYFLLLTL